jgi:adenylate cyclase, class 2
MTVPVDQTVNQTVEIKARCADHDRVRARLAGMGAEFRGVEEQTDTFYNVPRGRLKLRRTGAENTLIGYLRPDEAGPKHCLVNLCLCPDPDSLDRVLADLLGVRVVVRKSREIHTLGQVRFHLDEVEGLGRFVEIEVLGRRGLDSVESLRAVCADCLARLGIADTDLIEPAYADLLDKGSPA